MEHRKIDFDDPDCELAKQEVKKQKDRAKQLIDSSQSFITGVYEEGRGVKLCVAGKVLHLQGICFKLLVQVIPKLFGNF